MRFELFAQERREYAYVFVRASRFPMFECYTAVLLRRLTVRVKQAAAAATGSSL
jgi:hypothetical protein